MSVPQASSKIILRADETTTPSNRRREADEKGEATESALPMKKRRASGDSGAPVAKQMKHDDLEEGKFPQDETVSESEADIAIQDEDVDHRSQKKKSRKSVGVLESRWRENLNLLREYRKIHGDCLVQKSSYFKLGKWVARQRQEYKRYHQGAKSCMTEERIVLLENEGFVWVVREPYQQVQWEQRYSELRMFKEKHGTTSVPKNSPGSYQLALWCMNQRQEYRKRLEGKKHKLTEERITKLNSIGFVWALKGKFASTFDARLEQLKNYKNEFGNCDVPRRIRKYPSLGEWVRKMKNSYAGLIEEKLSKEMIERLQEVGLFKECPSSPTWYSRFDEFVQYNIDNGDCLLPLDYPDNPGLREWASAQREEQKKWMEGGKTSLTEDQLNKLQSLNFELPATQDGETGDSKLSNNSENCERVLDHQNHIEL